jgi:hypothetical protein
LFPIFSGFKVNVLAKVREPGNSSGINEGEMLTTRFYHHDDNHKKESRDHRLRAGTYRYAGDIPTLFGVPKGSRASATGAAGSIENAADLLLAQIASASKTSAQVTLCLTLTIQEATSNYYSVSF